MEKQFNNNVDTSTAFHAHHLLLWFIGALDIPLLKVSLDQLTRRHELPELTFTELVGLPTDTHFFSGQSTTVDRPEYEINRPIQTEAALGNSPHVQANLICLNEDKRVLLLTFHTNNDGTDTFAHEFLMLYRAFSEGQPSPELLRQVENAALERERLQSYWKQQLTDAPALHLPTDKSRPQVASFQKARQSFLLPPNVADGLKNLSKQEDATLFMTMTAAFQVLLHRYSNQDDIVICTPTVAYGPLETENLLGVLVNILALRTNLSGNPSFRELLAQVRDVTLEAYAHPDMPFNKLADMLNLERDPLFQIMLVFQDNPQLNQIIPELLQLDNEAAKFDLTLILSETQHGIEGEIVYATDLFEAATITRLLGHFQTLLDGITTQPETHLSKLPLLTETECRQLLVDWNDTAMELTGAKFIHHLFEEQVERTPDAVAVVYLNQQLTYRELNARANQLAHYLRHIDVEPETLVAISLERSIDQIVGWLGVLKAGGAYLPLDPYYPKDMLAFMLEDSAPLALLTNSQHEALYADMPNCPRLFDLSAKFPAWAIAPDTNPDHKSIGLKPENLAYVIYTSGSTGKPKGAQIVHQGLQNLLPWYIREATQLTCEDTVLVVSSMAFDATQKVIYGPLLTGARLVLASEPFDPQAIVKLALKERASMMTITPSGFYGLIDTSTNGELSTLRRVLLGGEPMQPSKLLELPEPRPEFFNCYGPTECTAIATFFRLPSDLEQYRNRPVPIGKPLWNVRIYILDTHQQPVPIGVAGEIYIGGVAVGRGYLNRPELTAERFVPDPFATTANARMYKTGDLARWLADGTIEFLSRNDLQVKIRGFRIELGDIEASLLQHPQIREVAVDVYEINPTDKRLVAYLILQSDTVPALSELRDFLKSKLPEYMVPSFFVFLDELPLTPNGKLDRNALPEPDMSRQVLDTDFIAPSSPVEQLLAEIWGNVLKVNRVGIHDNFFELGGQSLLATQVLIRVSEQLSVDIPLNALFEKPTIADLAKLIENTRARTSTVAKSITPQLRKAYRMGTT
ncbi:MAG: non-ribosomal peptide synthetase [Methylobacter sp.]